MTSHSPDKPLCVLIPAFDEAQRISETVRSVLAQRDGLAALGLALSVLVVDDGSRDDTAELARAAGADRVIRHAVNLGLGAAVRTGLQAAQASGAEIAVKFDADLQHDPADIAAVIAPILRDEAEVVYGNRFERISYRMPLLRRGGNLAFTRLMRWLTRWPVDDSQPGIFAVARVYLERFWLPGDYNYTQQLLLDAFHKGMRFAQVPVAFRPRLTGRSFVSLSYPFKVLSQIVMVLVGVKPMKVFAPIGLAFLGIALAVAGWQVADWVVNDTRRPVESVNLVLGTGLFGLQTLFFGLLAELIVRRPRA